LDGSLKDLFKIRRHLVNLILMLFIWAVSSFGSYFIKYSIKNLPGDFFMNNLVSAISDIILVTISGVLYAKLGLRLVFMTFFLFSMTGGLLIIFLGDKYQNFVPYMVTLAQGGSRVCFDVCFMANSALFPAIFAGTAFGFCNASSKIATIMAPLLAEVEPPIPMIIYVSICSLAVFLAMMLRTEEKETKAN
jgi:hypothetical protein